MLVLFYLSRHFLDFRRHSFGFLPSFVTFSVIFVCAKFSQRLEKCLMALLLKILHFWRFLNVRKQKAWIS